MTPFLKVLRGSATVALFSPCHGVTFFAGNPWASWVPALMARQFPPFSHVPTDTQKVRRYPNDPCWLVVLTILKNISQWEGLFHILWKVKNVPNHQPTWCWSICQHAPNMALSNMSSKLHIPCMEHKASQTENNCTIIMLASYPYYGYSAPIEIR